MGYDLHITRAAHWTESDSQPITLDEWLGYIASDPEMSLDNYAEAQVGNEVLRYDNEGLAVWTAYSGHGLAGNMAWFDYQRGSVVVKNPDEEIIRKMKQIAQQLHASVIGEEGERY
jgi:hypothetical protein